MSETPRNEFEKAAAEQDQQNLLSEFFSFLAYNKKWWMLPIVIVLVMLGVLIYMSQTAAAPFIYNLF